MLSAKSDVQVDTPEVRVTEWRLAPGSATGHHTHEMDYVIVPVTSGEMTIVAPNGERSKAQLGVGKSYFRKAGVRARCAQRDGKRDRVPGSRTETLIIRGRPKPYTPDSASASRPVPQVTSRASRGRNPARSMISRAR